MNDEENILIGVSISHDFQFQIQGINDFNEAWEKLKNIFAQHIVIKYHQIEYYIMNLNNVDFYYIEYYLSNF